MIAPSLATPPIMLMGFHYTPQFSRRNRTVVMGLVDQSTPAWERWYRQMHQPEAIEAMAEAGYSLIEIHFMYGFGPAHEAADIALTTAFTERAHAAGMRVIGYFQFFSVQQETFFLEHPWARECLQRGADGTPHTYRYDRPALCFSHPRVRRYYLDGIELGLRQCNLDGIRLDNDYYRGCYCDTCQTAFSHWLASTFDPERARRVFGFESTAGMQLVPAERVGDPLWLATILFRQQQRQEMMRELHDHVVRLKPDAILGGNPVLSRRPNDAGRIHVYPPDLGETHHLVCAENDLFPGVDDDALRCQVIACKHAQANHFRIFASHHLHTSDDKLRWPATSTECALSLCEGLAFGGHAACTTWGLRMDGEDEHGALYQRPEFMAALQPVQAFVKAHGDLYRDARCDAPIGVYINRESLSGDPPRAAFALYGLVETLLTHHLPFRFIDRDDQPLDGLRMLIVPDMRFVSDPQVERLLHFAASHPLLLLGDACRADEWMLAREAAAWRDLLHADGVHHLPLSPPQWGERIRHLPRLPEADAIAEIVTRSCPPPDTIEASKWIALESTILPDRRRCLHLLNYDRTPATVRIAAPGGNLEVLAPNGLGPTRVEHTGGVSILHNLRTYAIVITTPGNLHVES